jgi:hypothetical protein
MVLMPKGGTVDVSAIVQAIMSAAAVAGSAALFELLPGRGPAGPDARTGPPLPRIEPGSRPATKPLPLASPPAPAPRVPTRPRT